MDRIACLQLYVPWKQNHHMMTSWHGNVFRITGPLWEEFNGHRWIPLTMAIDADFDVFSYVSLKTV